MADLGKRNIRFLSTLSLRRATQTRAAGSGRCAISIHALLAESDPRYRKRALAQSISIHALLAESDLSFIIYSITDNCISIHALLAESDLSFIIYSITDNCISIHALLAESDQQDKHHPHHERGFLSTLSLRRATRYRRTS